ncbi:SAM-dependent methyltransferase [Actinomadura yumaensis]|uniref:SAM-dependent methyltransferase n=1 Tax=Actinomadura yumaensis TaxID=111807 RepID=A0ABW2CLS0_9ACTN
MDRRVGAQIAAVFPGFVLAARTSRMFLGRAVRYLAADSGARQFLDIGTGLLTADNTHEVAQRAAPDAKIVFVDNDPLVLAHAAALLTSGRRGAALISAVGNLCASLRAVVSGSWYCKVAPSTGAWSRGGAGSRSGRHRELAAPPHPSASPPLLVHTCSQPPVLSTPQCPRPSAAPPATSRSIPRLADGQQAA